MRFQEPQPLAEQTLTEYCSNSVVSAESRYSELVADEAGSEPDAEFTNRELDFLDCQNWEMVAPGGKRRARETAEELRRESNFRRRRRDLATQGGWLKKK